MLSLASALVAALVLISGSTFAQAPGDYPHLVLDDQQGTQVPPPSGPFDSTGEFTAFSGQSFSARVSYDSPGQANTNVFFGLLVSSFQTPLPETLTPPPLFTQPPFTLVQTSVPTLNIFGNGSLPLHVPLGLYGIESHVQGVIFDSSHSPSLQLSNGVTIFVDIPEFNVGYTFMLDPPGPDTGTALGPFGEMQLAPEVLSNLKPLGTADQPLANIVNLGTGPGVRFLPIIHNEPDAPVNPMTRPITRTTDPIVEEDTEIKVASTDGFPTRGRIIVAADGAGNPYADKSAGLGVDPPNAEVIHYDDISPTAFLGCERVQVGSNQADGGYPSGRIVLGDYSAVTTAGARSRKRVGTDFTNRDTPHVTVPAFDVGGETRDLDIYLYEQVSNQVQGFVILDRTTQTWSIIGESQITTGQGRWDPLIHVAPDGRSFVAVQRIFGGVFGWDDRPDRLWTFRLDGENWPASNSPAWEITYELSPNPGADSEGVRSRRIYGESIRILNTDPEDYVLYVGLAYKFEPTNTSGSLVQADPIAGFEAFWPREELIVRDMIECALVPPGSSNQPPAMPRPYISSTFPAMADGTGVERFDPVPLLSDDRSSMLIVAGRTGTTEDAFILRSATVQSSGEVSRAVVNISGLDGGDTSAPSGELRAFDDGGHGRGRRADFSPDGSLVAWVAQNALETRTEWLQIARTSGSDFSVVQNVLGASGSWEQPGPYSSDRIFTSLHWADNDTLLFMMGANNNEDPLGFQGSLALFDLFAYTVSTDTMVNLTTTSVPGSGGSGFNSLGRIVPGGSFASDSGNFLYFIRGGTAGSDSALPFGTKVTNVFGVNTSTLQVFDVAGSEFSGTSLIPDLVAGAAFTQYWPITSPTALELTRGSGVQDDRMFFVNRRVASDGSDNGTQDVFVVDTEFPFLAFPVTETDASGARVSNIVADPTQGRVAFARTFDPTPGDGLPANPQGPNQHLYVVDLDQFLFERDVMSDLVSGGEPFGRVMDGSVHFIPPVGGASTALVFSLGFDVLRVPAFTDGPLVFSGIAQIATPIYYSLASVSDPVTEPTPLLIPLVDTLQFGLDYRFYIPSAGPYVAP